MRQRYVIYFVLSAVILTAGFLLRRNYTNSFPDHLASRIEESLVKEYNAIEKEAKILLQDSVSVRSRSWDEAQHFFIRTDSFGIAAWNRSDYLPDAASLRSPGEFLFLSNQRGDFVIRKWPAPGGNLVNVLVLRNKYPIANGFLMPSLNDRVFPAPEVEITGPAASEGEDIRLGNAVLFRVIPGPVEARDSPVSFLVLLLGLAILAFGVNEARRKLEVSRGPDITLLALFAGLYGTRQLMVRTGIPGLFLGSDIFDPRVFASSPINATLGDLLLNSASVLLLVFYLFRHYASLRSVRWLLHQQVAIRYMSGMLCLLLSLFAVLLSYNFIEVIYHNSIQTLDISQSVAFSWVRATAFLSVLMGTFSAFLFVHVMASLARHLIPPGWFPFLAVLLAAAFFFWLEIFITGNGNSIPLLTGVLMLAGMRVFQFDHLDFAFSFRVLIYVVFSLTLFSIHHSLAVRDFQQERMIRDQFRYAKDFLTERDVLGEYLLDQVRQRVAGDPFVQTRMASPFFSRASVVEKIRRVHLNRYFDRYEQAITTRGATDSLYRPQPLWQPTGYPGVYYAGAAAGDVLKKYHVSIPITSPRSTGYVELDLVLKRVLPDNVFPELLVDNRFSQLYRNRDFSFAVYRQDQVLNSFGSFHYERDFEKSLLRDSLLFQSGLAFEGYYHVGIEEADGSVAVVSSRDYAWGALITNTSFWFVLGLVALLGVQGVIGLLAVIRGRQFAYAARIQLFMFFAFALPMVAVSITTLTMMARSNEENTTREFLERSTSAAQRLATLLAQEGGQDPGRLEGWVSENASFVQTDVSVYTPAGRLTATSQPSLFDNHLISALINRKAYRSIIVEGRRQAVCDEQIGTLGYSSVYAAVLSPQTGELQAIVSLPFFESASYLQRVQARVLSTILQVFVVVFLVFTLLSFFAAESLASPIRFMAKTLRQTTLSGENKPLTWNTRDEMGMLVQEYNRMVANLEESRRALAQSEKESAWREMAKQVAHEIKNPLTPMKLTLQQLEKAGELETEKSRKSVEVMLRQVEILDAIASSFSTLARMPVLEPQRTDLVLLVSQTSALFSNSNEGTVRFTPPEEPLLVSVDQTAFSRAISNIIINALQARVEGRPAIVEVEVTGKQGKALIAIRDNGRGIQEDLQDRIFQPQFTTKDSGSGLGLYMARQCVLQSGGKIWYETKAGQGSTFYIELPIL